MATVALSPAERSYILSGLSHPAHPTRSDGRALLDTRPISISYGDAPQASGSARVRIAGGTEVVAGIRLEVADVDSGKGKGKGKEGWRGKIDADVTPQAYPSLSTQDLARLSTHYSTLLSSTFLPAIPALPILPPTKYFIPTLHLTLHSASSGSVLTALSIAARAAFCDLKVPKIKRVGWEVADQDGAGEAGLAGIKGAVRAGKLGKQRGRREMGGGRGGVGPGGQDWELDGGDEEVLDARENLPVLVSLNLMPDSDSVFLDPTPQEEAAAPSRLHLFFTGSTLKLCGLRMEGPDGLSVERIRPLLLEGRRIAKELTTSLNAQIPT